jgi:7,8-dihydro-6-hydroxymethylpterin dimethyltransferase
MPRLKEREETYFTTVRGMCRRCRSVGPARVFFHDGKVWQQSLCPCGPQEAALIASDSGWYLSEVVRAMPDRSPLPGAKPPRHGCPHDCGPCTWHASPCQLPVLSITNACNLRCPICFTYNRDDRVWHSSVEEMRRTVDWIAGSGRVDLINITGGEPTLHPDLEAILGTCRRPEIGRITMNSNGIRLAEDFELCRRLAELGVCVILSLNTLDAETSRRLHGCDLVDVKRRAIENLARADVRMTLLNVLIRGVNESALGDLLGLMREYDHILSLTVQMMTYTGQGGSHFPRSRHVPVNEAVEIICRESDGLLEPADFTDRPAAHPLCYRICYLLRSGSDNISPLPLGEGPGVRAVGQVANLSTSCPHPNPLPKREGTPSPNPLPKGEGTARLLPFARFAPREEVRKLLADSYLLRPAVADDFFTEAINQLYAAGQTDHLATLRGLVERLYPPGRAIEDFERQRLAEQCVRTIYLHAHMDEDTFDCSRAMLCPDLVPAEAGRWIPACTYNLFYRTQDERFFVAAENLPSPFGRGAGGEGCGGQVGDRSPTISPSRPHPNPLPRGEGTKENP